MAARIGGSVLTVIQGSGHFTPLEQPAAVTAALRQWLQMPVDIDSRKPYH
jgi:pimeloyl-ACP methyl ester carboxylesterase